MNNKRKMKKKRFIMSSITFSGNGEKEGSLRKKKMKNCHIK
jgi:hypothetical protein